MAIILDFLIGSCLKKLQDVIEVEAAGIFGVKDELIELRQTMLRIQHFLSDAEERRLREPNVNAWLRDLIDAMDYGDDIIDTVISGGGKLLSEHTSSSSKSTTCSDMSVFTCIPNVLNRRTVASQIRKFKAKLEKISKYGETGLNIKYVAPQAEAPRDKQKRTMSLDEPNIVGDTILNDCEILVDLVLAHNKEKAYKLGIVGTGGVGKTTLAQKIYNDPKIKATFSNQKAWICVSREYSDVDLLKEVLQNFGVSPGQDESVAQLGSKLAKVIKNRSFFLVLDNVWNPEVWTNLLRTPLHYAATGVIIVTTRYDAVALAIGADYMHSVELMSAEVGWELLQKRMNMNEEQDVLNLRNIGLEVVGKCGRLPLAINLTASVLATKNRTENEWRKVLTRGAWNYDNVPAELRGALYTSYDDLPRNLKQCFLYLALYPEDQHFFRDDVIRLWVTEGLIEQQKGQLLEETAEEYYYELIGRNLIRPDGTYFDLIRCKMHDLLRQLACYLTREENFIGDPESMSEPRRRILVVSNKNMLVLPNMDNRLLKVRTLRMHSRVSQGVDDSVFKKLLCLRVLNLTGSSIETIPVFIDKLIHLRLLDLDDTRISFLPESIGSLMNLQILNLRRCGSMHRLPLAVTQLCNLRQLGLSGTPINLVPKGIGKLKFLNDIEGFPVGGGNDNAIAQDERKAMCGCRGQGVSSLSKKMQDGWELKELGLLSELRRILIMKLERAAPGNSDSFLKDKSFLRKLDLLCSTAENDEPYSEEAVINIEMIFEQLIPPVNLEDLGIRGFFGRKYPAWLGTSHLASLKHLTLIGCGSWPQLPPLSQLRNLEFLCINGAAAVTRIGPEILGCNEANSRSTKAVAFPKLKTWVIRNMPNWEEWSSFEDGRNAAESTSGGEDGITEMRKGKAPATTLQLLPCLKHLELANCPKLRALPPQLGQHAPSLNVLHLVEARCLNVVHNLPSLSGILFLVGCEALESVSDLPEVRELVVEGCPELRYVQGLDCLQQLQLGENMEEVSRHWRTELQRQRPQLGVYHWSEIRTQL